MNIPLWKTIMVTTYLSCIAQKHLVSASYCSKDVKYQENVNDRNYHDYNDYGDQQGRQIESITVVCSVVNLSGKEPLPLPYNDDTLSCSCPHILKIEHSPISSIPPSTFVNYPLTTILSVIDNDVETILPGAFNTLTSLEELYLCNNNITYISDGIFNSLVNLKVLDLSGNKIQNISKHAFSGVVNLQTLNLSFNALQYMDSEYLIHVRRINTLDVSFNQISLFNFTNILDSVENLNVSNNRIDSVYGCFAIFKKLDLKNNLLTTLENTTCMKNVSNLVHLDLSYNLLSSVKSISNLNKLEYLFLQNNKIDSISIGFFSELYKLKFLNLSSNELDRLQYGLFDRLSFLNTLDISNNHLTAFKKFNYHLLQNLHQLYLHDNELTILDSKYLLSDLINLKAISLSGNNFTCDVLVEIFHDIKKPDVVLPGHSFSTSNIHGIACLENGDASSETDFNSNLTLDESLRTKLNKIFNSDFTKSSMYNYFNKDFKKSNFYKYLENMKLVGNFNNNSYDKSFINTQKEYQATFNKSVVNYFNNDFRNSNFVKYLEKFKSDEDILKNDVTKSAMYNYFNKDFVNSNFYKYLEALKKPQFEIKYSTDGNNTKVEKLISNFDRMEEKSDNSALLVVIIVILIIISCTKLCSMYINYNKAGKLSGIKNEQVELIEA